MRWFLLISIISHLGKPQQVWKKDLQRIFNLIFYCCFSPTNLHKLNQTQRVPQSHSSIVLLSFFTNESLYCNTVVWGRQSSFYHHKPKAESSAHLQQKSLHYSSSKVPNQNRGKCKANLKSQTQLMFLRCFIVTFSLSMHPLSLLLFHLLASFEMTLIIC